MRERLVLVSALVAVALLVAVATCAPAAASASVPEARLNDDFEDGFQLTPESETRTGLHLRRNSQRLRLALRELWDILSEEVNPFQLAVDIVLAIFTIYVLLRRPVKPEKPLDDKEISELIDEWEPEPLFPAVVGDREILELESAVLIEDTSGATHVTARRAARGNSVLAGGDVLAGKSVLNSSVVVDEEPRRVLHLGRTSFLGYLGDAAVQQTALDALYKYGTGSCGPRGFYGTIDAHLELEQKIREFTGSEDALIYAYGFATVSSVIPCFAGRGDLLVVDKGVSFPVQTGVNLSRSTVQWFEHNDMDDLERVLKAVHEKDQLKTTPKAFKNQRRFIIVEGCYQNTGNIVPLPRLAELKEKYKFRVVMDESYSLGVLGDTGRGVTEHFQMPIDTVELISANLATSVSSVGGLCLGDTQMVYHMRLHAYGYVYSASLPPLLAKAAEVALGLVDDEVDSAAGAGAAKQARLKKFWAVRDRLRSGLEAANSIESMVKLDGDRNASLLHIRLADGLLALPALSEVLDQERVLQGVCDRAFFDKESPLLLVRSRYIPHQEKFTPTPSIRVTVSSAMSLEDIDSAKDTIVRAVTAELSPLLQG